MSTAPTRPVMRYHGGKWKIAKWVISHLPPHRIYVEPFGGAGSVLLRKPPAFAEVYNDMDGDVVNVFRVLRDPEASQRLRALCHLTPWSRTEFWDSYSEAPADPVERARRSIFRSFAAHGSTHRSAHRTGFRAKAWRSNRTGIHDWQSWPEQIPAYVERMRGVVVECRPATEIIEQQDSADTLFYCDPPYPISTRSSIRFGSESDVGRGYAFNPTDDEHRSLAELLHQIAGMAVISGYPCDLYDLELFAGWHRVTRSTMADGARKRTEVLWLNPRAADALNPTLFTNPEE